jgi:predicted RNA-binding Zn-ribbon protein involved in translation (DUF1610 family)
MTRGGRRRRKRGKGSVRGARNKHECPPSRVHIADAPDPAVVHQQKASNAEVSRLTATENTLLAHYLAADRSGRMQVYSWLSSLSLMPFAACFMWRVWIWRRKSHRWKRNLCMQCGYSLNSNVSGVCPECGSKIVSTVGDRI